MTLETGIRGEQSVLVTAANTAKTMGSGTLDVFATPALVALAEKTCWMSVADALGEGNGSVGTKLELEHTAPTPVGMTGFQCHILSSPFARRMAHFIFEHLYKIPHFAPERTLFCTFL